jgi:hypothetical protein
MPELVNLQLEYGGRPGNQNLDIRRQIQRTAERVFPKRAFLPGDLAYYNHRLNSDNRGCGDATKTLQDDQVLDLYHVSIDGSARWIFPWTHACTAIPPMDHYSSRGPDEFGNHDPGIHSTDAFTETV